MFLFQKNGCFFKFPKKISFLFYSVLFCWSVSTIAKPTTDIDNDKVIDIEDNCSEIYNPEQLNSDNDAFGNACDGDYDNNNIVNSLDFALFNQKFITKDPGADLNENGEVDLEDLQIFYAFLNQPPGPGAVPYTPMSLVKGYIVDTDGLAINDSQIEVFQEGLLIESPVEVTSNQFSINLPATQAYTLSIQTPGYADKWVGITMPAEDQQIAIRSHLIPRDSETTIATSGLTTQSSVSGAQVTFDKADFVNAEGLPISDEMQLSITALDISRPDVKKAFPGRFSGTASDQTQQEIVSLGAVEFHFTANSQPVNLAPGKTAEVTLPLFKKRYQDGSLVQIGDEIPLWSLNETTGHWQQEGFGTIVASDISSTGLSLKATTQHFSWWNYGYGTLTTPVTITVLGDTAGTATILAEASDLNWNNASTSIGVGGTTEALPVPVNTEVCFEALIFYANYSIGLSQRECFVAAPGEDKTIILRSPLDGELNIVTRPASPDEDKLSLYTPLYQPVPLNISALTQENNVSYAVDGTLPTGLFLEVIDSQAFLIGKPTELGRFDFTILGTDEDGHQDSIEIAYHVEILPANAINLPFNESSSVQLNIALHSGTATINWNDGSPTRTIDSSNQYYLDTYSGFTYARLIHNYASPRVGSITITYSDGLEAAKLLGFDLALHLNTDAYRLSPLKNLQSLSLQNNNNTLNGSFAALPNTLQYLYISTNYGSITGTTADLPAELLRVALSNYLQLTEGAKLTGDIKELSRSLNYLNVRANELTGDVAQLPAGLTHLTVEGDNTLSGDIADLPANLNFLKITGQNTLRGAIENLPENLTQINLYGQNTIEGDVAAIPDKLETIDLAGQNRLAGDIANLSSKVNLKNLKLYSAGNGVFGNIAGLPENLSSIYLWGNNSIQGDIGNFPEDLGSIVIWGQNTLSGDIDNLSSKVTRLEIHGNNTIAGNIDAVSESLVLLTLTGNNKLTGDIGAIPRTLAWIDVQGQNTVSGNIAGIPEDSQMLIFMLGGYNTITGNIANIRSRIQHFQVWGENTLWGDIGQSTANDLAILIIRGNNQINDFAPNPIWQPTQLRTFDFFGNTGGYDVNAIDRLLIFLSDNTVTKTSGYISLMRDNDASPTAAADSAIATLEAKNFRVYVK
ncbi:MAG: hypothetical protein AAGB12_08125 [Pseudomonadota bacterium]